MAAIAVAPIRTTADHQVALRRVEVLLGARPGTVEADELDIWTDLIAAYERRHYDVPTGGGAEVLRHLLQSNGLTQSDIPDVGTPSSISLVLSGRRPLTLRQIRTLVTRFNINPSVFI
jgi:HTH-type transcriptional regulator/antitoxin HigA